MDCFSDPARRRRRDGETQNRKEENFQQQKGDGVSVAESTELGLLSKNANFAYLNVAQYIYNCLLDLFVSIVCEYCWLYCDI